MLEFFHVILLKQTWYCISPILFHASEDSLAILMCGLLIEFVDSYSTFILLILFVGSLVMFKNLILRVFTLKTGTTPQANNFSLLKRNLSMFKKALTQMLS